MKTLDALDLDRPVRCGPAIGFPKTADAPREYHLTAYLGRDENGEHVSITTKVSRAPQHPEAHQTRTHGPVPPDSICLSFTAQAFDPTHPADITHGGAWAEEACRSITDVSRPPKGTFPTITDPQARLDLARIAERWHLNDMCAACDHMPTYHQIAAEHARIVAEPDYRPGWLTGDDPEVMPEKYGRPDWSGWALAHVVCPESGYRYGHAWLHDIVPGDVLDRLCVIVPGFTDALDALDEAV